VSVKVSVPETLSVVASISVHSLEALEFLFSKDPKFLRFSLILAEEV
jgi:hypothetical protein